MEKNIYQMEMEKKPKINILKLATIILIIVVLIGIIMIAKNSIKIINQHKIYEQYQAQLEALQKEKEEKQYKIEKEKEKIRQSRIPKLTQERKKKYGKHISCRK